MVSTFLKQRTYPLRVEARMDSLFTRISGLPSSEFNDTVAVVWLTQTGWVPQW